MRSLRNTLGAALALAVCETARAAAPSNDEQYWLELTNRMRLNPQAELAILTNINPGSPPTWASPRSDEPNTAFALEYFNVDAETLRTQWTTLVPAPALAWNNTLHSVAAAHNGLALQYQNSSHQYPGENDLGTRLTTAGYPYTSATQNVFTQVFNVFHGHAGFAIDWGNGPGGIQNPPGNRTNIMSANYREVGLALTPANDRTTPAFGPLVMDATFGRQTGAAFLSGVLYNDAIDLNHFYTPGEGLGGVTVDVFNAGTATLRFSTTSTASGGFTQPLPAGTYDVRFSGGGLAGPITYRSVVMGTTNVKLDSLTTWLPSGGGNWTSSSNWNGGVPNGAGTRAYLGSWTQNGGAVSLNTAVITAGIDLDNTGGFTVSGAGSMTLDATAGDARLAALAGSHTISVPLTLADHATIDVASGSTLNVANLLATGVNLLKRGGGTVTINRVRAAALDVQGGSLTVTPDGAATATSRVTSLAVAPGGALRLNNNDVIVDYSAVDPSPESALRDLVLRARDVGDTGIFFTETSAEDVILAFGEASELAITDFNGLAVDGSTIVGKYTYYGDANFDGQVTTDDYVAVDLGLGTGDSWVQGDFDLNGAVTTDDYVVVDLNLGKGTSNPLAYADEQAAMIALHTEMFGQSYVEKLAYASEHGWVAASVPEPSVASLLVMFGAALAPRRRGRNGRTA